MFSFLWRKKKPANTDRIATCPDCSALISGEQNTQDEIVCPACGKLVNVQETCGTFT